jgi:GT2 family glycosyltransferase
MHVDVDTCLRLRAMGWELQIASAAHIAHEVGGSTDPFLATTLERLNREIVISKQNNQKQINVRPQNNLDFEFLYEITRKSSFLFLDVADVASGRLEKMRQELNNEVRSNILKNLMFRLPRKIWRLLTKYSK